MSRSPARIGSATTVPRYPMSVFYNTATQGRSGRRVQLDLHQRGGRRERVLHRPPGRHDLHHAAQRQHGLRELHRADREPDRHAAHPRATTPGRTTRTSPTWPRTGSSTSALNAIINNYKSLFATNTPITQPGVHRDSQILTRKAAFATTLAGTAGVGEVAPGSDRLRAERQGVREQHDQPAGPGDRADRCPPDEHHRAGVRQRLRGRAVGLGDGRTDDAAGDLADGPHGDGGDEWVEPVGVLESGVVHGDGECGGADDGGAGRDGGVL